MATAESLNPCFEYLKAGLAFHDLQTRRKEELIAEVEGLSHVLRDLKELRHAISEQRQAGETIDLRSPQLQAVLERIQARCPQLLPAGTAQLEGKAKIEEILYRIDSEEKLVMSDLTPLTHAFQQINLEQTELTKIVHDALRGDHELCSKILSLSIRH